MAEKDPSAWLGVAYRLPATLAAIMAAPSVRLVAFAVEAVEDHPPAPLTTSVVAGTLATGQWSGHLHPGNLGGTEHYPTYPLSSSCMP